MLCSPHSLTHTPHWLPMSLFFPLFSSNCTWTQTLSIKSLKISSFSSFNEHVVFIILQKLNILKFEREKQHHMIFMIIFVPWNNAHCILLPCCETFRMVKLHLKQKVLSKCVLTPVCKRGAASCPTFSWVTLKNFV